MPRDVSQQHAYDDYTRHGVFQRSAGSVGAVSAVMTYLVSYLLHAVSMFWRAAGSVGAVSAVMTYPVSYSSHVAATSRRTADARPEETSSTLTACKRYDTKYAMTADTAPTEP
eukprot:g81522.t1